MRHSSFTIRIQDETLRDLHERLQRARLPLAPLGEGWQYGTDLAYLRELVEYWRDRFDWRAQEARINGFRQFTVDIGDTPVHFIHQPGAGRSPRPLLLLHGWPGSVWEFHKLIPLLEDTFAVVAPSLPGYGFSFRPGAPLLDRVGMARVLVRLMTDVLGYRRFAVQGGDIGAVVAARIAEAHPGHVDGLHLNYLGFLRALPRPAAPSAEEERYFASLDRWLAEEAGYSWIQGTKPQTLAFALNDSPIGLAAWIIEKFRTWSDCDGDIERAFTKDELLTDVMLYWATQSIGSSFWPYYTARHGDWSPSPAARIEVPTAYIEFPREIIRPPRSIAEQVFRIERWTVSERGGHFAALEQPEMLAADIRDFLRRRS